LQFEVNKKKLIPNLFTNGILNKPKTFALTRFLSISMHLREIFLLALLALIAKIVDPIVQFS
jgi:hypothetical protein